MDQKMNKKKKATKRKQKIDVVIESLVHLEQRVKELIDRVESLHRQVYYHPEKAVPKKYWPVDYPKYKDVTWDAIDKGLQ